MVHGKLGVGTEAEPFEHRARIVLTGSDPAQNVMNMGTKFIGVMGGTLDLHGEARKSWTKLTTTAPKGTDKLTVEDPDGWRVGDRIVVASTDYDPLQAEEATIKAISGGTITLDKTLANAHWGTVQTVAGRPLDERAEVALLSRNVTVEGEQASSAGGFGGQIMVMGGTARIDGTELTRMGQKNILRRYPIHFHMLGNAGENSYVRGSSLHKTFNRCVTIHGTNKLNLTGNVCHDHLGHGFFMEDGAEVDNVLDGNLGMTSRRPAVGERLLPSDESPATFWVTNPDNVLRNNVAAGGFGIGFWLAFPEHPTGLFAKDRPAETAAIWPRRTPLGAFSGNAAHSYEGDGLHVDRGPRPNGTIETAHHSARENPADTKSPTVVTSFEDFTGYKNRGRAVWLRGSNHVLSDPTLADNAIGATFASDESFLEDGLVVGESANKGTPRSWETKGLDGRSLPRFWDADFPIRGFEYYDGRVGAERTAFANFSPNTQRRAGALGFNLSNHFNLHPKNFATALSFVDANRVYLLDPEANMDGDRSSVFLDTDGSVTGTAGRTVAANNPFLLDGSCARRDEWNAHVCATEYATLDVGTLDGDPAAIKPLKLTREDGVSQTLMGCCDDSTTAHSSILPNAAYDVAFNGATPKKARFVLARGSGRFVRLGLDYPVEPKVTKYGCDVAGTGWCGGGKAASLAELDARTVSGYYYDAAAKKLHLKIVAGGTDYEELQVAPSPIVGGAAPPETAGTGTGLKGEYFDNTDLTALKTTRTDGTVAFDWGYGIPPGTALTGADTFSARWTGEIEAPETADYNFVTTSDDGVRLWVCGRLVVDDWTDHAATDRRSSAPIPLTAGQRCEVRMEYYENGGGAVAKLQWDYAGYRTHPVPRKQLYAAP
ncbi:transmembrane domain-containing protein [Rubrobacter marinus]|uniref:Transmembrane domain-containing protein n=2 Tax=Rubrobacter marinus TaxID=2653852 RepID=A0A6G8PXP4_9ACTN|nr:transmembrane domain-containing protein [Rubrobacter marinus]